MSNQPENEIQQSLTPEEVRQYALDELEASKQVIKGLSDEELEEITGGLLTNFRAGYQYTKKLNQDLQLDYGFRDTTKVAWATRSDAKKIREERNIQDPAQLAEHLLQNHQGWRKTIQTRGNR